MARRASELGEAEATHRPLLGAVLAIAAVALLLVGLLAEPLGHEPLPAIAREATTIALPRWHTDEPVNEIVYGTRGFDTFGETFILLAAVVGLATVARKREPRRGFIGEELLGWHEESEIPQKGTGDEEAGRAESREEDETTGPATPDDERLGTPAPEKADGMTIVVRGAVRVVSPILLVAGIYLAAWGYSPGGGFPAGGVVLGVVLLAYVGYGYPQVRRVIRRSVVEAIELGGALLIILLEAAGLVFKGSFSANWLPLGPIQTLQSGGLLQAFSGAELIEVGTGLIVAIFGLLGMAHDWAPSDRDDQ